MTGTELGPYIIEIAHDVCSDCRVPGSGTVFRFKTVARNAGEKSTLDDKGYIQASCPTVMQPSAFAYHGGVGTIPLKNVRSEATRQWKVATEPEGAYAGSVSGDVKFTASQSGYLETMGLVGIQEGGSIISVTGANLTWTGSVEASGGGMATSILCTESFASSAPWLLVALSHYAPITKDYESTANRTLTVNDWILLKATVELTGEGTGLLSGLGAALHTTNSPSGTLPPWTNDTLSINEGNGLLLVSTFLIAP